MSLKRSREQLNAFAPGLSAIELNRATSLDKLFKYQLIVRDVLSVLIARVLENGVCILVLNSNLFDDKISQWSMTFTVNTQPMSGKKKSGAPKIRAGQVLSKMVDGVSGRTVELTSPISGRLLELNSDLMSDPSRLLKTCFEGGYIAVIIPEGPMPDLLNPTAESILEKAKDRSCFDWARGSCARGDSCKFQHES